MKVESASKLSRAKRAMTSAQLKPNYTSNQASVYRRDQEDFAPVRRRDCDSTRCKLMLQDRLTRSASNLSKPKRAATSAPARSTQSIKRSKAIRQDDEDSEDPISAMDFDQDEESEELFPAFVKKPRGKTSESMHERQYVHEEVCSSVLFERIS